MKSRGENIVRNLFINSLDKLYPKDLKKQERALLDSEQFFEFIQVTKKNIISERKHALDLLQNHKEGSSLALDNYSFHLITLFQERAFKDPLVVFTLRVLADVANDKLTPMKLRKRALKEFKKLVGKATPNLKGKKDRLDIFKLRKQYEIEKRRIRKKTSNLMSHGNMTLTLKEMYPSFSKKEIEEIAYTHGIREKAMIVVGLKNNWRSKRLKDLLAEAGRHIRLTKIAEEKAKKIEKKKDILRGAIIASAYDEIS